MVGPPGTYPGHHPYPPTTTGAAAGTYLPNQAYPSPCPLLSTLLPYDGRPPQGPPSYPWAPPEPINTTYLYPPSNPTTFAQANYHPYTAGANYQPNTAYPPAGYPPQPQHNNPQAPTGYPTGHDQHTGSYAPPTYAYPPPTSGYPTHQAPPYGAGNYSAPGGGAYPRYY